MKSKEKIVILGAGLIGRLLAVTLSRMGYALQIYEASDKNNPQSAAHIAAAMLAPLAESAIADQSIVQMGIHSLKRWQQIIPTLEKKVFFQQAGTLLVWHRQDANEAIRFKQILANTAAANQSLTPPVALSATAIGELEPNLSNRFNSGYHLPDEGQIDNRQLMAALLHELETQQVAIHWNTRVDLNTLHNEEALVIDCRGLGAKPNWPDIRGVRGEVIRLHAPEVQLKRPVRLIHPKYPIYIAPKENDLYVIGATEIESEDLSPVSLRSMLELMSAAYTIHSGFAEARILEMSSNCRPALKDNKPAIQIHSEKIIQVNGLYRHGFMIAPAIVDACIALIDKQDSTLAEQFEITLTENNYAYLN